MNGPFASHMALGPSAFAPGYVSRAGRVDAARAAGQSPRSALAEHGIERGSENRPRRLARIAL